MNDFSLKPHKDANSEYSSLRNELIENLRYSRYVVYLAGLVILVINGFTVNKMLQYGFSPYTFLIVFWGYIASELLVCICVQSHIEISKGAHEMGSYLAIFHELLPDKYYGWHIFNRARRFKDIKLIIEKWKKDKSVPDVEKLVVIENVKFGSKSTEFLSIIVMSFLSFIPMLLYLFLVFFNDGIKEIQIILLVLFLISIVFVFKYFFDRNNNLKKHFYESLINWYIIKLNQDIIIKKFMHLMTAEKDITDSDNGSDNC